MRSLVITYTTAWHWPFFHMMTFWETMKIGHWGGSQWAACHQVRRCTNLHLYIYLWKYDWEICKTPVDRFVNNNFWRIVPKKAARRRKKGTPRNPKIFWVRGMLPFFGGVQPFLAQSVRSCYSQIYQQEFYKSLNHIFTNIYNCRFVHLLTWWQAAHWEPPPCPIFPEFWGVDIFLKGRRHGIVWLITRPFS